MAAILACTATAMAVSPGDLHTKNFGCAGNGTTDDTVNFQSAINAAMSSGSRLFIDPGTYLISAPLVISSPMTMLGAGQSISIIKLASGTIDGIDVTSLSPVQLENFRVSGVSGATAGALIKVGPSSVDAAYESFRDLSVENGFIAINMNNAILWSIDRCVIDSPASIGVLVQSLSNPDEGDSSISNTIFRISSTGSAIWQTSSGGLRVENNKFLAGQHGYVLALNAGASTSDLIIVGNSFEEQSMDSITGIKGSGPGFANIVISGNQFALAKNNINFNDQTPGYLSVLSINGNIFRGIGPGSVAITLNGESVFSVNSNTIEGQGGEYRNCYLAALHQREDMRQYAPWLGYQYPESIGVYTVNPLKCLICSFVVPLYMGDYDLHARRSPQNRDSYWTGFGYNLRARMLEL